MAFCGVFGWWGIPWGLLATPIQLGRNFLGLFRGPNPDIPSRELRQAILMKLGQQAMQGFAQSSPAGDEPIFDEQ